MTIELNAAKLLKQIQAASAHSANAADYTVSALYHALSGNLDPAQILLSGGITKMLKGQNRLLLGLFPFIRVQGEYLYEKLLRANALDSLGITAASDGNIATDAFERAIKDYLSEASKEAELKKSIAKPLAAMPVSKSATAVAKLRAQAKKSDYEILAQQIAHYKRIITMLQEEYAA